MLFRLIRTLIVAFVILFAYYYIVTLGASGIENKPVTDIVKQYPGWVSVFGMNTSWDRVLYPRVYVSEEVYNQVTSGNLNNNLKVDVERWRSMLKSQEEGSPAIYALKYLFFKKFRLSEIMSAYSDAMSYAKNELGMSSFDLKKHAVALSSGVFLNTLDFDDAYALLYVLWNEGIVDMSVVDDNFRIEFPL